MKRQKTIEQILKSPKIPIPNYSQKFKHLLNISHPSVTQIQKPIQKYDFYKIKIIGIGAHSTVSLIQEDNSKTVYAQKSITKNHAIIMQRQLINQLKIHLSLQHQNIIGIYHIFADELAINILMEYAELSLFKKLRQKGKFNQEETVRMIQQTLQGLKYIHSQNIVHADIKLQNILQIQGCYKICDFGYAFRVKTEIIGEYKGQNYSKKQQKKLSFCLHERSQKKVKLYGNKQNTSKTKIERVEKISQNKIIGTMEYLAPEYARGQPSTYGRDIWAVGIMAFELLFGFHPLDKYTQGQKWEKLLKFQSNGGSFVSDKTKQLSNNMLQFFNYTICPLKKRKTCQQLLELPLFNQCKANSF